MTISAAQYHLETSYRRDRMDGHSLDWANQPGTFKSYPQADPLPLPREVGLPEIPLSTLIRGLSAPPPARGLTAVDLARLFLLTYSLTAKTRHPGGDFYYRTVASAGALYPTEIYGALRNVSELEDGLYHFSIAQQGLTRLRTGDYQTFLRRNIPGPVDSNSQATFIFTAIFFRSSWKYRARAYRYHLLDTGHVLEHLLLALPALNFPAWLSFDFADQAINQFLGINERQEGALAVVQVPGLPDSPRREPEPRVEDLDPAFQQASRVSEREVDYPLIRDLHQAGLAVRKGPGDGSPMARHIGPAPKDWTPLSYPSPWPEKITLAQTILTRRSRRNFVTTPLPRDLLSGLLESLVHLDRVTAGNCPPLHELLAIGCLVGSAEAVEPGFYLLEPLQQEWGMVTGGKLTRTIARICLDQDWLAQAAVHFLFMGNLRRVEEQWGPRGYRYALMTAGRLGERLYLTATALGLGCCGIGALYDQEAANLLGLNADSRLLYLVAVGPVKSKPPA
jgi:SagB-type dehydrogenase family enzyme